MFSAPIASAAAFCDNSGYTSIGEPIERCTSLSNGVLIVHQASNGVVSTTYDKSGGSTISAQLGYSRSGTSHYTNAVSISAGQNKAAARTRRLPRTAEPEPCRPRPLGRGLALSTARLDLTTQGTTPCFPRSSNITSAIWSCAH